MTLVPSEVAQCRQPTNYFYYFEAELFSMLHLFHLEFGYSSLIYLKFKFYPSLPSSSGDENRSDSS